MRGITLSPDDIAATVEGINVVRDRIPVLAEVRIHYSLRVPAGSREVVDRALERHVEKCPTAVSLKEAVRFTWTADVTEEAS